MFILFDKTLQSLHFSHLFCSDVMNGVSTSMNLAQKQAALRML